MKTPIVEIMSSIQGEGLVVGYRQVFIRFPGCNIACQYCDTKHQLTDNQPCHVEVTPGHNDVQLVENPLSVEAIVGIISKYPLQRHHSISLTGGEPLLHVEFLKELIPAVSGFGPQIYLETNGTLPQALAEIIDLVDIIAMDIKLPSVSGCTGLWQQHAEFLRIANSKQVYVKAVIGKATSRAEIQQLCSILAQVDKNILLVLQPVTPTNNVETVSAEALMDMLDFALQFLPEVRIIPQTHRMIGVL